jgi:cystathionine gamma-synthase
MATENDVEVGESLPPMTEHVSQQVHIQGWLQTDWRQAVSVSLPTWRANVGYEEGEEWVISKMKTGYPRYVVACHSEDFH